MAEVPLMKNEHLPTESPPPYDFNASTVPKPQMMPPYGFDAPVHHNNPASPTPIIISPPSMVSHVNIDARGIRGGGGFQPVGKSKLNTTCMSCQSIIRTKTATTHKCCTHCCCLTLCLTGVFCPLIFLPYCCCSPEKVEHTCPKCNALIGTYYG